MEDSGPEIVGGNFLWLLCLDRSEYGAGERTGGEFAVVALQSSDGRRKIGKSISLYSVPYVGL